MNFFSTRKILTWGLWSALLLILFFTWYTYRNVKNEERESLRVAEALEVLNAVELIMDDMQDLETGQRGFIISGDTIFLQPYDSSLTKLKEDTLGLLALSEKYPGQADRFSRLLRFVRQKTDFVIRSVNLRKEKGHVEASQAILSGQGRVAMDSIRFLIAATEEENRALLKESNTGRELAAKGNAKLFATLAALFVIAMLILLLRIRFSSKNEKLQEKRIAYLANLVESSGDAIFSSDINFRVISWNKGAEELYGYTSEEAIGQHFLNLLGSRSDENKRRQVAETVIKAGIYKGEFEYTKKDGADIFIYSTVSVVKNDEGEVTGFVCVHKDITAKKKLEQQLKRFNEELEEQVKEKTVVIRDVFERVSDAIIAFDKDWRYSYINSKAEQLLNRPPGYLLGRHVWSEFPEMMNEPGYELFMEAMEKQEYRQSVTYFAAENRWFENHIYPSSTGLSIYFRDITERRKADLKLQEAVDRFNTVAKATNDIIWEAYIEQNIVWWNDNFFTKFGYARDDGFTGGEIWESKLHPNDFERVVASIRGAIANKTKSVWTDEYRFRKSNGDYAHIYDRCTIIRNAEGNAVKVVGCMTDITDLVKTAEKLKATEDRYRIMVEEASDAIFINDQQGCLLEVNNRACDMLRYSSEQLGSMTVADLFPEDELLGKPVMYKELLSGERTHAERNMKRSDGTLVPVDITAQMLSDGRIVAIVRDVSEQKEAKEKLAASEKLLKQVLYGSIESFYVVDRNCRITLINEVAKANISRAWQYPVDIGTNILEHVPDEAYEPVRKSIEKVFAGNKVEYELHVDKEGLPEWVLVNYIPLYDSDGTVNGAFISTRDITERKQAEETVKNSEQQLKLIYNTTSDINFLLSVEPGSRYNFRSVNQAFLTATGLTDQQVVGTDIEDIIPSESLAAARNQFNEAATKKQTLSWEETIVFPSGKKTGIVTITPVENEKGECVMLLGAVHDITERKKAEDELLKSREDFSILVNSVEGIVWEADAQTVQFTFVSRQAEKILGYPVERWTSDPSFWKDHIHPEDREWAVNYCIQSTRDAKPHEFEYRMIASDGRTVWVRDIVSVQVENGKPERLRGIMIDITEQKKAEAEIRKFNERFSLIANVTHDAIWEWNIETGELWANNVHQQLYGLTKDDPVPLVGEWQKRIHPDDIKKTVSAQEMALTTDTVYWESEYRFLKPGGNYVFLFDRCYIIRNKEGKPVRMTGSMIDITERRKAEEEIKERAIQLYTLSNSLPGMITYQLVREKNGEMKFEYISESVKNVVGVSAGEVLAKPSLMYDLIIDEDRVRVKKAEEASLRNMSVFEVEVRSLNIKGELRWFYIRSVPRQMPDGRVKWDGVHMDITERKRTEEEIVKARNIAEKLIDTLPGVFYFYDETGKFIRWNKQFELVTGYSGQEIAGMQPTQFFADDTKEYIRKKIKAVFEKGMSDAEADFQTKSGQRISYYFKAVLLEYEGKPCLLGSGIDISERRRAEEELRTSEKKYKLLFETNPLPMWMTTIPGLDIIEVNEAAIKRYGYSREEFIKLNARDLRPQEDVKHFEQEVKKMKPGITNTRSWRHKKKDGSVIHVEIFSYEIVYEGKRVWLGLSNDITEKVKAEEALKASEKKYKLLFENNPMPMWMLSLPDYRIIDVNESATRHYGYSREEFLQLEAKDINLEKDIAYLQELAKRKITGIRYSDVLKHKKKDGTLIDAEVISHDIDYDGKPARLILSNDVTEKIKAEQMLKKSIEEIRQLTEYIQTIREEERAHIAREIHDELGQQLTVLKMDVSWLNKKVGIKDEAVKQRLSELTGMLDGTVKTVRRISSELRPSLLDDLGLIAAIDWHLREFEKRMGINARFEELVDETMIPEHIKTGIFRIFQESLTNVARHSGASELIIKIEIQSGNLLLTIEDNGKGFNMETARDKKTLGILGMKERTAMLGGKYEISSKPGKGTTVIVSVPLA